MTYAFLCVKQDLEGKHEMFSGGSAALLVCLAHTHTHTHTHTHNMTFRKLFTAFPRLDIKTSPLKKEHGNYASFKVFTHTLSTNG